MLSMYDLSLYHLSTIENKRDLFEFCVPSVLNLDLFDDQLECTLSEDEVIVGSIYIVRVEDNSNYFSINVCEVLVRGRHKDVVSLLVRETPELGKRLLQYRPQDLDSIYAPDVNKLGLDAERVLDPYQVVPVEVPDGHYCVCMCICACSRNI